MSLLMKALEKAAKDRGESAQKVTPSAPPAPSAPVPGMSPIAAPPPPKPELSLEPLPADIPAAPEPSPAAPARASAAAKKGEQQARAAKVLQATATTAAVATTAPRIRPVIAIGVVGGLAVIGFAIYVYLQITNPALFIARPPSAPQPPLAQTPPPAAQPPIATSTLVAPAAPSAPAATAPAAEAVAAVRDTPPARPASPPVAAAAPPRSEAPRDQIKVSAGSAEPQLDQRLVQAYAALRAGRIDSARQLYADVVRSEPKNIQALLGSAAVAMQENRTGEASRLYFQILDLEPRNAYAQTGLVALMGRADPAAAEAKLKQLIAREPLASLHFTLGNLYGDQSRWAEAQQSYFQAYHLESGNPDYAYNLAVGLEHVGQTRLAIGYYRRALELAQAGGRAGFNVAQVQDRTRQLAAQPQ